MGKLICLKRSDGGISVMHIEGGHNDQIEVDKWEESFRKHAGVKCLSYREITEAEIPIDKTFRQAWVDVGKIEIDMVKARKIHMENIRELRNAKLKELDIDTMKGDDVQAQKQTLRDLPATIDLTIATTPEELKNTMPVQLIKEIIK